MTRYARWALDTVWIWFWSTLLSKKRVAMWYIYYTNKVLDKEILQQEARTSYVSSSSDDHNPWDLIYFDWIFESLINSEKDSFVLWFYNSFYMEDIIQVKTYTNWMLLAFSKAFPGKYRMLFMLSPLQSSK